MTLYVSVMSSNPFHHESSDTFIFIFDLEWTENLMQLINGGDGASSGRGLADNERLKTF